MTRENQEVSGLQRWIAQHRPRLPGSVGKSVSALLAALIVGSIVAAIAIIAYGVRPTDIGAQARETVGRNTPAPNAARTATPGCITATAPACLTSSGDWIPISSDTPAAVLAAFRQSGMYSDAQTGAGDGAPDLTRPEAPIFERELHVPGGLIVPDMYVIPFDTATGSIGWFALCNVNAAHTAIEVGEIAPGGLANGQPRPHGQLTPIVASNAAAAVHAQRGVQLRVGMQPSLVFVEIDASLIETGQVSWSAPAGPQNPYWLVPGADGHDYLVDTTGKAHLLSEVPIEMSRVATPPAH